MEEKIILPQNTRLMGALLGFVGGGLDVFCHMHYRSLVATQTGNLLLLIADWHDPRVENTMLTFTGSLIENHPYVIFMTSGNYRKMLTALYRITRGKGDLDEYRRQAMNYGIVVGSFVAGAISVAILMHFIHQWAIWLITANLFLIMTYYTARVKQLGLQTDNL